MECFCGCGRKVKGLRRRGYNTAGRDALQVIGLLNHAKGVADARKRGDAEGRAQAFARLREDGEHHAETMKEIVHGSRPFGASLAEFKAWKTNARGFASMALLDPRLQALMAAGASESELRKAQADLG
jgi:hypothetical protein